jgi:signal peptidase II
MRRKYWVLLIVGVSILLLDQWTKHLVLLKLPLHDSVQIIPGFFNLTHVRNTGGAFGVFGGKGPIGSIFFIGISVVAVGVILFFFAKLKDGERSLIFALPLVLSGALGNLIDRLRHGEVVDFIDLYVSSFHWPSFNIADSAICIGIGLMALELLTHDLRKRK